MIEKNVIIESFNALAHEARLDVFLWLIQAGPEGISAGELASRLGIAANALSFHLTRLRHASLVYRRRAGKQIIYCADYDKVEGVMEFLRINCCRDADKACSERCAGSRGVNAADTLQDSA